MKKLMVVDDTLKELGTSKIYQKIYTWSCYVIIGWIVWIILLNFNDTLAWLILLRVETASWRFIVAHVYNYSFHVNTLEDLIFIVFIWFVLYLYLFVYHINIINIFKNISIFKNRTKKIINILQIINKMQSSQE